MITPELITLFESTINTWPPKKKIIAQNLMVDETYQFIRIYDNKKPKLFLRNIKNGMLVDFEKHVSSKCNC